MTTGKRTKKPGSAKDSPAPDKEAASSSARSGAGKEAKARSKGASVAKGKNVRDARAKAKPKATKAAKAKTGPAPLDPEPIEDTLSDDGSETLDDDRLLADDLDEDIDAEEEAISPVPAAAARGRAAPARRSAGPVDEATDDLGAEGEDDGEGGDAEFDDEEDGEAEEGSAAGTPAKAARPKAPAARRGAGDAGDPEQPAVVPARRLTPEAKAKLNELLAKGVSLDEALRQAAQWETFVAPVRETPPAMDRMRPAHRPAERTEREPTIDDLDTVPEEEAEEGIE